MKKMPLNFRKTFAYACSLVILGCSPPFKPDYNVASGLLIFKSTCQNQQTYLMDIAFMQPYENGDPIQDTLTIAGVTYNHVVRLDSAQSAFLSARKVNDKLSIHFLRGTVNSLPACAGLPAERVETIKVLSADLTDYK